MVDNTTADWFGLKGREESGWTAIQFKRALDTCDTMDVPIKVRFLSLFLLYNSIIAVWLEYSHLRVRSQRPSDDQRQSHDQVSRYQSRFTHYRAAVLRQSTAGEQIRRSRLFRVPLERCE